MMVQKGKSDVMIDVVFGELQGACDALLVGFPTMLEWRTAVWKDDDGIPWVTLGKYGISMPCERPTGS